VDIFRGLAILGALLLLGRLVMGWGVSRAEIRRQRKGGIIGAYLLYPSYLPLGLVCVVVGAVGMAVTWIL
jgi:uncharacterized membrane protein YecN with MAPEG domain